MMFRYFAKYRTYKYINVLQDFVTSYNATPHSSINDVPPRDVNIDNQADIFGFMYLRNKNRTLKTRRNRKPQYKFKLGSLVRISYTKQPFQRAYHQQWSSEIFKVKNRFQ